METIPFSYAYAYVTPGLHGLSYAYAYAYVNPGLHGLSYAYAYACACAYVVRVNQAIYRLRFSESQRHTPS